ncbi:MAG: hypothetical protein ACR2LM_09210 [Pyrinomonadaceae bacterium]
MINLRVTRHVRFGFAAGVGFAAVALPRHTGAFYIWAMPTSRGLRPNNSRGKARTKGAARK